MVRTAVEVVAGRVPGVRRRGRLRRAGQALRHCRQGRRRRRAAAAAALPRRGAPGRPGRLTSAPSQRPPTCPSSSTTATTRGSPKPPQSRSPRSPMSSDSRTAQAISTRWRASCSAVTERRSTRNFLFFNGLPTAETTQHAYRAIGVPLYSSATFAFAPDLALAFYDALESGNEELIQTPAARVLPPAGPAARHRARLRRVTRQGRRRDGGHPRRTGPAAAGHAEPRRRRRAAARSSPQDVPCSPTRSPRAV